MKSGRNPWYIRGIQETEELGECVLICEEDADSVLVFFKINSLKPGAEDFQALDVRIADERHREGKVDNDEIKTFQSLMTY